MSCVKIQISINEKLLTLIDEYAKDNFMSRSGVFAQATASLVNANRIIQATQDMAVAMKKIADEGKVDNESVKQIEDIARVLSILNQRANTSGVGGAALLS